MKNDLISRPCISPRQLCFWVFMALVVYPQLSHHMQMLSAPQAAWSAQPSQIAWDLVSSLGLMLGIALVAAILATVEARYLRPGGKAIS